MGGMFGGLMGMPKSSSPSTHEHTKRQQLSGLLGNLMPKATIFIGGGGSVGSGSALAVPESVSHVKSGAYIGPKDLFQFTAEVINYEPVEKDIYLTIDFEWVPGKVENLHDVGMGSIWLDCAGFEVQPPKDRPITFYGGNWTTTMDGYFVNFTPHLHDGAVNIKVFLNGRFMTKDRHRILAAKADVRLQIRKFASLELSMEQAKKDQLSLMVIKSGKR
jgi:hypothetical protein